MLMAAQSQTKRDQTEDSGHMLSLKCTLITEATRIVQDLSLFKITWKAGNSRRRRLMVLEVRRRAELSALHTRAMVL